MTSTFHLVKMILPRALRGPEAVLQDEIIGTKFVSADSPQLGSRPLAGLGVVSWERVPEVPQLLPPLLSAERGFRLLQQFLLLFFQLPRVPVLKICFCPHYSSLVLVA